jgi:hypothetical protein
MASSVNFGTQQYFGFDPRTIPGCCLWMDAADARTLTTSGGGNVTQWADKSGLGATMTPFGANSNATIQTNYRNGLSALNFSGLNQYQSPSGTGVYPSDVYILVALKTLTRMDVISIGPTSTDNFNSLTFGEHTALRWHNGSSSFARTPNTVSPTNETSTSLLLMNWSLADNNFVIRRNGTQLSSTASYTYTPTAGAVIQIGFRHQNFGTNLSFDAYVGEVLTFNRQLGDSERQQVEGYLAWKWALTSNLPSTHPFRPAPPIMRGFLPVDVSGAALWLDAADTSTLTLSGTNVTEWRDKSGNGLVATSVGNNPAVLSGMSILFTGTHGSSSTRFTIPDTASLRLTTPFTIYMVYSATALTPTGDNDRASMILLSKFSDGGSYPGWAYRARTFNPSVTVFTAQFFNSAANQGDVIVTSSNVVDGTRKIVGLNQRTTTTMFTFVNGSADLTITPMAPPITSTDTFMIGARNPGNPTLAPFNGSVNEIAIMTGSLSRAQCQQLEGYLAWKWGLGSSLPTTHPYYRVLPSTPQFVPTSISNCVLWFDAADTTTITGTTQVTVWTNKGTLGGNATNRVGSCTSGSTANGLNYVRCPVGADLQFTAALNTQARSWFYVARQVTPLTTGTFAGLLNQLSGTGQNTIVIAYVNATTVAPFMGPTAVGVYVAADVPAATLSSIYMLSLVNSATVSLNVFTLNGTAQTLKSSVAAASYRTASSTYLLGTAGYNTAVDIMEAICYYGDLSVGQRQQVEGYLAWKWGLQTNLPSTHPFAKFRP